MRIFVTGATGYIGSALVRVLRAARHDVTGLVRSAEKGRPLEAFGAKVVVGDLKEPAVWIASARAADAVIHAGFERGAAGVDADRLALQALLEAASTESAKQVVYTSGVLVLGPGSEAPADEDTPLGMPFPLVAWRPAHEQRCLAAATDALVTTVIRPGFVYGGPTGGSAAGWFETAEREGAAVFVGDGTSRLAMVHLDDLADLYHRVLEQRAGGVVHGVDGANERVSALATAASEAAGAGGKTRGVPVELAVKAGGPWAAAMAFDQNVSTRRATALGWRPRSSFTREAKHAYAAWRRARASS
jgi:nucleoside-diphosphate-sugar epimerase